MSENSETVNEESIPINLNTDQIKEQFEGINFSEILKILNVMYKGHVGICSDYTPMIKRLNKDLEPDKMISVHTRSYPHLISIKEDSELNKTMLYFDTPVNFRSYGQRSRSSVMGILCQNMSSNQIFLNEINDTSVRREHNPLSSLERSEYRSALFAISSNQSDLGVNCPSSEWNYMGYKIIIPNFTSFILIQVIKKYNSMIKLLNKMEDCHSTEITLNRNELFEALDFMRLSVNNYKDTIHDLATDLLPIGLKDYISKAKRITYGTHRAIEEVHSHKSAAFANRLYELNSYIIQLVDPIQAKDTYMKYLENDVNPKIARYLMIRIMESIQTSFDPNLMEIMDIIDVHKPNSYDHRGILFKYKRAKSENILNTKGVISMVISGYRSTIRKFETDKKYKISIKDLEPLITSGMLCEFNGAEPVNKYNSKGNQNVMLFLVPTPLYRLYKHFKANELFEGNYDNIDKKIERVILNSLNTDLAHNQIYYLCKQEIPVTDMLFNINL